jgi:hypothetical protein
MQIEITEKEKTALSILLGLRQKFSREKNQSYSSKELQILFSELLNKINKEEMIRVNPTPKEEIIKDIDNAVEKSKWYPLRVDFAMVDVLKRIAEINLKSKWAKCQFNPDLIKEEEQEITIKTDGIYLHRLVWLGLIERQHYRSGYVRITSFGINFLRGKAKVPNRFWVSKGKVMVYEDPYKSVYEVKRVVLDKKYWDNFPINELNWLKDEDLIR